MFCVPLSRGVCKEIYCNTTRPSFGVTVRETGIEHFLPFTRSVSQLLVTRLPRTVSLVNTLYLNIYIGSLGQYLGTRTL